MFIAIASKKLGWRAVELDPAAGETDPVADVEDGDVTVASDIGTGRDILRSSREYFDISASKSFSI